MADYFLDNFAGTAGANIASRLSDSGHQWEAYTVFFQPYDPVYTVLDGAGAMNCNFLGEAGARVVVVGLPAEYSINLVLNGTFYTTEFYNTVMYGVGLDQGFGDGTTNGNNGCYLQISVFETYYRVGVYRLGNAAFPVFNHPKTDSLDHTWRVEVKNGSTELFFDGVSIGSAVALDPVPSGGVVMFRSAYNSNKVSKFSVADFTVDAPPPTPDDPSPPPSGAVYFDTFAGDGALTSHTPELGTFTSFTSSLMTTPSTAEIIGGVLVSTDGNHLFLYPTPAPGGSDYFVELGITFTNPTADPFSYGAYGELYISIEGAFGEFGYGSEVYLNMNGEQVYLRGGPGADGTGSVNPSVAMRVVRMERKGGVVNLYLDEALVMTELTSASTGGAIEILTRAGTDNISPEIEYILIGSGGPPPKFWTQLFDTREVSA